MTNRMKDILPFLAAVFVDLFSFGLMYPVLDILFRHLGATHAIAPAQLDFWMALSFAAFPAGMFFGASLLGDLSDAVGRKRTLLVCLAGLTFAYALMFLGVHYEDLGLLLTGRLLSGLMAGSAPIAQAAMMDLSRPDERSHNMSKVVLANCLALASAPTLGGLLLQIDLSLPLLATLLLCLSAFALIARARWTDRPQHLFRMHWARPVMNFVDAARHRKIRSLTVTYLLFQLGFATYYIYVVLMMGTTYHLAPAALGFFSGTIGIGFVLGSSLGYRWAVKLLPGDRAICIASLLACGTTMMLSAFAGPLLQWPLAFIAAVTDTTAYITILALVSAAAGIRNQGWAMGVTAAASAVAFFLAGMAADLLNILPLRAFLFCAGALLIAGALPLGQRVMRGRAVLRAKPGRSTS